MKVCKNCGYEGDFKYCPNCGNLMQEISIENTNNVENEVNDSDIDKENGGFVADNVEALKKLDQLSRVEK